MRAWKAQAVVLAAAVVLTGCGDGQGAGPESDIPHPELAAKIDAYGGNGA